MQDVQHWPDMLSLSPQWRVTVNGVRLEPEKVDFGREMSTGLPAQVVGGLGVISATGTITLASDKLISAQPRSPWGSSLPQKGDPVLVDAGFNGIFARVFTGRVLSAHGQTGSPVVTLKVVDETDRLRRRVKYPPFMSTGPRLDVDVVSGNYVSPGLTSTYFLSSAAASCGFHAVPAPVPGAAVYASMNGSAVPVKGVLVRSSRVDPGAQFRPPLLSAAPWGQGFHDVTAGYTPDLTDTHGRVTSTRPLKMSCIRGKSGNAESLISAWWGDFYIRLAVPPSGNASLSVRVNSNTTRSTIVPLAEDEVIVAEYHPDGSYRVQTSGGADVSGQLLSATRFRNNPITEVSVATQPGGVQIGGVQVWFGSSWGPLDFRRTAFLYHVSYEETLHGTRAVDTDALALINEIGDAEMGAAWLDAYGQLWFRNRATLVSNPPVRELTSLNDLLSYEWEITTDSVKGSTSVDWTSVALSRSFYPTLTLWEGSGETIETEDEAHQFIIGPGADEEWLAVDRRFLTPWDDDGQWPSGFRQGRFSWSFGSSEYPSVDAEGEPIDLEQYRGVVTALEQIGLRAWKLTQRISNDPVQQVIPAEPTNLSPLPKRWHGGKLPILRGKGRMNFHVETAQSTLTGPDWAETYHHDAGQWVQSEPTAIRLANALQSWMIEPLVVIRGVQVHPDPRLELGDVVMLQDDSAYDRRIRALITGMGISGSRGEMQMSLDVQVLASEPIPGRN